MTRVRCMHKVLFVYTRQTMNTVDEYVRCRDGCASRTIYITDNYGAPCRRGAERAGGTFNRSESERLRKSFENLESRHTAD